MLYLGLVLFSFFKIPPLSAALFYHDILSCFDFGDERLHSGDELPYFCGIRISVVKAPSSLFRLIYPSRRSIIVSILIKPRPCPGPFVV